jgi:uncharacterized protein YdeI (YjbR/CyaY-like superfamily)
MKDSTQLPIIAFESQKAWEIWLKKNHTTKGVWIKFFKKASGIKTVVYKEALDVALCYGWIDSQANTFDDKAYIQKFTPRGPRSIWSKVNTEHVARLIDTGKMRKAGLEKVDAAKADGRWERAYASPSKVEMPEDFKKVLAKNKKAKIFYETLNKTNTYGFITRLHFAKKPETRERKIKEFIAMLERGEKLH